MTIKKQQRKDDIVGAVDSDDSDYEGLICSRFFFVFQILIMYLK